MNRTARKAVLGQIRELVAMKRRFTRVMRKRDALYWVQHPHNIQPAVRPAVLAVARQVLGR